MMIEIIYTNSRYFGNCGDDYKHVVQLLTIPNVSVYLKELCKGNTYIMRFFSTVGCRLSVFLAADKYLTSSTQL